MTITRRTTDPDRDERRERAAAEPDPASNGGEPVVEVALEHGPHQLPRGRHGLSREEVVASQRQRILDAMAELCAERGYPAVRIAEIVGRAGVSRATFYELFRDKEDSFVAAMEEALKRLFNAVMPAAYGHSGSSWPDQVRETIAAFLGVIAAEPEYSQMAMVESLAGGDRTFERYTVASQVLMTLLDQGRAFAPPDARIPSSAARAVKGAGEALIIEEMISGRIDRVPDLLPDILYIALTPYLGQAEALRRVAAVRRR